MDTVGSYIRAASAAAALTVSLGATAATIPFTDSFDSYAGAGEGSSGQSDLNWTGGSTWTVSSGTVDLVANGDFGLECLDDTGKCVDLDGSTSNSGVLSAATFSLVAGQTYRLGAWLSGNQLDAFGTTDDVSFGFRSGSLTWATTVTLDATAKFSQYFFDFVAPSNMSARIFFNNDDGDGDNKGPIADGISLTAVPLPAAAWLMLSGLVGLGAVSRRRVGAGGSATAAA